MRVFYSILCACVVFTCAPGKAHATEWPSLRYWPGSYGIADVVRYSSDGKYITLVSSQHVAVIDAESKYCVFTIEFALTGGPDFNPDRSYKVSVAESGDEFVVADSSGRLAWYHVGDTLPWREEVLDRKPFNYVAMPDDTTTIVGRPQEIVVYRTNAVQPEIVASQIPAEMWLKDSLAVVTYAFGDSARVFNPYTSQVLLAVNGDVFGVDEQGRLLLYIDDDIYTHDIATGVRTLVIDSIRFLKWPLIRGRFLPLRDEILDLRDNSRRPNSWEVRDVLASGAMITNDRLPPTLFIDRLNGAADTIPVLMGQVYSHTQDPLDSTIYVSVAGGMANGYGVIANYASIKPDAIWIQGGSYTTTLSPFRKIRDTGVVEFTVSPDGTNGPLGTGYMSFEDFHTSGPTVKVNAPQDTKGGLRNHFFRFSQYGAMLSLASDSVHAGNCTYAPTYPYPVNHPGTGFIPGTDYYVHSSQRHHYYDCNDVVELPFYVVSLSLFEDRAIGVTGSNVVMASVSDPTLRYATVVSSQPTRHTWSHAGKTFRFTTDKRNVTSMYSNGDVKVLQLPISFPSDSASTWWWSHDGSVLTIHSMDTIVTIDIETGDVLREYVNIPWLRGAKYGQVIYRVSEIDARILVSMPSGSLGVVPGLAINGRTSVHDDHAHDEHSHAAYELGQALTINNALPNSDVRVYSVHGIEVLRSTANAAGRVTLADKGLPHGSYVVVYATAKGMRAVRLLQ